MDKKYTLFTAISMVVGIVIGSGIFFKTDEILSYSSGNLTIVVFAFLFVALGVLFGALVLSNYAQETAQEGGIIKYAEKYVNKTFAQFFGWFMVTIYTPSILAILAYVAGIYFCNILGLSSSAVWITSIFLFLCAVVSNYLSRSFGGYVQVISMVIKLIPIIIIPFAAIFISQDASQASTLPSSSLNLFGLLLAIAFSFDGWYIATAIAHEVKDTRKNMPRALILGILITTIAYIMYTIGMQQLLGTDTIINLGDEYVNQASTLIFGNPKIMTIFIFISVYGGLNGMTLASFRIPTSLVHNKLIKNVFNVGEINPKTQLSISSVILMVILFFVYMTINYFSTIETNFFYGFAIDALPIIMIYIFNGILILSIIPHALKGKFKKVNIVYSVLGASITFFIVIGSALADNGLKYIIFSVLILTLVPFFREKEVVGNNE